MSDYVIRTENLGKKYRISTGKKRTTFRDLVAKRTSEAIDYVKLLGVQRDRPFSAHQEIWALKDISFSIKAGESVGIIGSNGAGKSTLLKILARITAPTTGKVHLKGRVGSLLEVGTGFHAELTGRENVYLNGAILGMKRLEIDRKFDEIVAFSEISDYLDTPVKHYSSGMRMRLAFSVAAHLEPEILLIDEVLAVGDISFQRKCLTKMEDVAHQGKTIIFVSHNIAAVKALCDSAIYLEQGRVKYIGNTFEAIKHYVNQTQKTEGTAQVEPDTQKNAQILSITSLNNFDKQVADFQQNEDLRFRIRLLVNRPIYRGYISLNLYNVEMELLLATNDVEMNRNVSVISLAGLHTVEVIIPGNLFVPGDYFVEVMINYPGRKNTILIDHFMHLLKINIMDHGSELAKLNISWRGSVHPDVHWVLPESIIPKRVYSSLENEDIDEGG